MLQKSKLVKVSLPIYVELLLTFTLFFTDSFFLSTISDEVAGAIGSAFPVLVICTLLMLFMAQAGAIVAAQWLGKNCSDSVILTYMANILIVGEIGFILSWGLFVFRADLGQWLGFEKPWIVHLDTYLKVVAFAFFINGLRFAYNAILVSRGETHWNMKATLLMSLANIGLNVTFLKGGLGIPPMGIMGVALATVISQLLAFCAIVYVVHQRLKLRFPWFQFFPKFKKFSKPIFKIGIPSVLEPISFQINQVIIQMMVVQMGIVSMSTKVFVLNISMLGVGAFTEAFGIGNQMIIARLVGSKQFDTGDRQLKQALMISLAGAIGLSLIIYFVSETIFSLFTNNPLIIQLGSLLLLINGFAQCGSAINIVVGNALRGAGDARYTAYMSIFITWMVGLPTAYFLGIYWEYHLIGIWLAMVLDEWMRAAMNWTRWRQRLWQKSNLLK